MIFGITEAGDASKDYSWTEKVNNTDMSVIITKHIADEFIEKVIPFKNKVIIHATCTGYGGTVLEPNVPDYKVQLDAVKKLIRSGFPTSQIVVRIDPVIPTAKGLKNIEKIVSYIYKDVKRFRMSVIDNYQHIQQRFSENNLPVLFGGKFSASDKEFAMVDEVLSNITKTYGVTFECCAEPKLKNAEQTGCISQKDLSLFGLTADTQENKGNRYGCLCLKGKKELLKHNPYWFCNKFHIPDNIGVTCGMKNKCKECNSHTFFGCSNKCLYCYWKS